MARWDSPAASASPINGTVMATGRTIGAIATFACAVRRLPRSNLLSSTTGTRRPASSCSARVISPTPGVAVIHAYPSFRVLRPMPAARHNALSRRLLAEQSARCTSPTRTSCGSQHDMSAAACVVVLLFRVVVLRAWGLGRSCRRHRAHPGTLRRQEHEWWWHPRLRRSPRAYLTVQLLLSLGATIAGLAL